MKISVLSDAMPCCLVDTLTRFRGPDSLICGIERKVAACSKGGYVSTKLYGAISQKGLI